MLRFAVLVQAFLRTYLLRTCRESAFLLIVCVRKCVRALALTRVWGCIIVLPEIDSFSGLPQTETETETETKTETETYKDTDTNVDTDTDTCECVCAGSHTCVYVGM